MRNQQMARGFAQLLFAAVFAIPASAYPVGSFARAGPGLFPLLVSGIVGAIGLFSILQARLEPPEPVMPGFRNLLIVISGLVGFALIARYLGAIAAIVFLVFVVTLADATYSVRRNLKICAVLIGIAFAFRYGLGVQLPLY